MQVVLGAGVAACEARTCPTEESRDGNHRRALSQAAGEYGAVLSMSRPGRFWGNGQCESFLKTLKQEEIDARPYHSMEQLEEHLAEFIEQIYNKVRLHSSLGSWSPEEFEARLAQSGTMPTWLPAGLRFCRHAEIPPASQSARNPTMMAALWGSMRISRGVQVPHTVRAGRGKSHPTQFPERACQRATQVVLGVRVAAWKARTSASKESRDGIRRDALSKQFFGNPLVGDTPIGLRESLRNPQPMQPGLIDITGHRGRVGRGRRVLGERTTQRSAGCQGTRGTGYLALGGLQQGSCLSGQTKLGVQEPYPGSVPVALAPQGFLIGEAGQPSQMTPIAAGQVSSIGMGQLSADGAGNGRLQWSSADPNPGLETAGAGLEHDTRLMPIGSHLFQGRRIAVVQIQQDIAGVAVLCVRLDVNVTPLTVANAQKSYGRLLGQLSGRPQPFTGECPTGIVVNQADQIQLMRHGRELPADGLQRDEQSTIQHKRICRREGSPYNALMVRPHGREGKICSVKGKCPISRLSQKRAQAKTLVHRGSIGQLGIEGGGICQGRAMPELRGWCCIAVVGALGPCRIHFTFSRG